MAPQDNDINWIPIAVLLIIVVILLTLAGLGIWLLASIAVGIGLYYIVKLAMKAALNESRVKIERESALDPEPREPVYDQFIAGPGFS